MSEPANRLTYAYQIRRNAVLLDEDQWGVIAPLLENRIKGIQDYVKKPAVRSMRPD